MKTIVIRAICRVSYELLKAGPSVDTIVKKYEGLMKSVKESSGYYTILDDMNPDWWVIRRSELYPWRRRPLVP